MRLMFLEVGFLLRRMRRCGVDGVGTLEERAARNRLAILLIEGSSPSVVSVSVDGVGGGGAGQHGSHFGVGRARGRLTAPPAAQEGKQAALEWLARHQSTSARSARRGRTPSDGSISTVSSVPRTSKEFPSG